MRIARNAGQKTSGFKDLSLSSAGVSESIFGLPALGYLLVSPMF